MPRYSEAPYGLKPAAGPRFPANAQPIASAPQASPRRIRIFEPNGKSYAAMYYKGAWQKTATERDPYSGAMHTTGETVNNPIVWTSS